MSDPAILDWHLGVGDAVICNGLVRELAKERSLILPAHSWNLLAIQSLFSDLENVAILPAETETEFSGEVIGMKHVVCADSSGSFDEHFYRKVNIPWECRYSSFKIPAETVQGNPPDEPFVLSHGSCSDGRRLNEERFGPGPRIRVEERKEIPIGGWVKMIAQASEIHCVDSALIHLVESVPSRGTLFFHAYARGHWNFALRKEWIIV